MLLLFLRYEVSASLKRHEYGTQVLKYKKVRKKKKKNKSGRCCICCKNGTTCSFCTTGASVKPRTTSARCHHLSWDFAENQLLRGQHILIIADKTEYYTEAPLIYWDLRCRTRF